MPACLTSKRQPSSRVDRLISWMPWQRPTRCAPRSSVPRSRGRSVPLLSRALPSLCLSCVHAKGCNQSNSIGATRTEGSRDGYLPSPRNRHLGSADITVSHCRGAARNPHSHCGARGRGSRTKPMKICALMGMSTHHHFRRSPVKAQRGCPQNSALCEFCCEPTRPVPTLDCPIELYQLSRSLSVRVCSRLESHSLRPVPPVASTVLRVLLLLVSCILSCWIESDTLAHGADHSAGESP